MAVLEREAAPVRSHAQRMEALERANDTRSYRKELKRDLKHGVKSPVDVVIDPPELVHTMKVFDLLLAIPKVGRVKANKVLIKLKVSPSKTVGGLSERQRRELALYLPALRVTS